MNSTLIQIVTWAFFAVPVFATALTDAIRLEDPKAIEQNLKASLINQPGGGYHPISLAVIAGKPALVSKLLQMGADPNQLELNGKSPLYLAAQRGRVDLIELLHLHKAKHHPHSEALHLEEAAVFSGSAIVLKKVLELYPKASFSWDWRREKHYEAWSNASALTYALHHGYHDIAEILLAKDLNVKIDTRGLKGVTALHFAVADHRCPLSLVEKLLDLGLSPRAGNYKPDLAPGNSIDLAAFYGYSKKMELLTRNLDNHNSRGALLKAACIARYRGHPGISASLLKRANASVEDAITYCREMNGDEHWSKSRGLRSLNRVEGENAGFKLVPNIFPKLPPGVKRGSLAILASDDLANVSALLFATLSDISEVTLVEREQMNRVAAEASLSFFKTRKGNNFQKNLELVGAENILLLAKAEAGEAVIYTLLNSAAGIITYSGGFLTKDLEKDGFIANVGQRIADRLASDTSATEGLIAFTRIPLVAQNMSASEISLAPSLNYYLQSAIGNQPEHVLLSRDQFDQLGFENALGKGERYWRAGWVVDGGYHLEANGQLTLNLRASSGGKGKRLRVKKTGNREDLRKLVGQCWNELSLEVSGRNAGKKATVKKLENDQELAELRGQVQWFLSAGLTGEALELSKAIVALSGQSRAALQSLLVVYQRDLPISWFTPRSVFPSQLFARNHEALKMPESLHLDAKFRLYQYIDDYLNFSQILLAYSDLEENFHIKGYKFLHTLYDYRMSIEGLQVESGFTRKIDLLDRHINAILKAAIDASPAVNKSYSNFIDKHGYLSRYQWGILKDISPLIFQKSGGNRISALKDGGLFWNLTAQLKGDLRDPDKIRFWKGVLRDTPHGRGKSQLSALLFPLAENRKQRLNLMRSYINNYNYESSLGFRHVNVQEICDFYNALRDCLGCEDITTTKGYHGFQPIASRSLDDYMLDPKLLKRNHIDFQRCFHTHLWLGFLGNGSSEYYGRQAQDAVMYIGRARGHVDSRRVPLLDGDWRAFEKIIKRHYSEAAPHLKKLQDYEMNILNKNKIKVEPVAPDKAPSNKLALDHIASLYLPPSLKRQGYYFDSNPSFIDGDMLYLNVQYFPVDKGVDSLDDYRAREGQLISQINLKTGRNVSGRSPFTGYGVRYFIPGDRFIYGVKNNPDELLVIEKSTMKIKKVELPQKQIGEYTEYINGDRFYLVSTQDKFSSAAGNVSAILEVEGFKDPLEIVSSFRKPASSPLDNPGIRINDLRICDGQLRVRYNFSTGGGFYLYNPVEASWQKLNIQEARAMVDKSIPDAKAQRVDKVSFEWNSEILKFTTGKTVTSDFKHREPATLGLSRHHLEYKQQVRLAEISFTLPNMDDSFYSRESHYMDITQRNKYYTQYYFATTSRALELNFLQFDVLERWDGKYLIVLGGYENCLPEIWSIDAKILEDYAKNLLKKN